MLPSFYFGKTFHIYIYIYVGPSLLSALEPQQVSGPPQLAGFFHY